jgi:hypothetical protein
MSNYIKELVKELGLVSSPVRNQAALTIERLAGEVERLTLNGIHTCHDNCQRLPCVQGREIRRLEGEVARLRAELQMVLDEFGYSLPLDTKASISAAIRAAAGSSLEAKHEEKTEI